MNGCSFSLDFPPFFLFFLSFFCCSGSEVKIDAPHDLVEPLLRYAYKPFILSEVSLLPSEWMQAFVSVGFLFSRHLLTVTRQRRQYKFEHRRKIEDLNAEVVQVVRWMGGRAVDLCAYRCLTCSDFSLSLCVFLRNALCPPLSSVLAGHARDHRDDESSSQ